MNFGNVINEGIVSRVGECIFFSNITSDEGKLYKSSFDLSKSKKICDYRDVRYLTHYKSKLYFVSHSKIYKYSFESELVDLVYSVGEDESWITDMFILNDYIYFCTGADESNLMKLKVNGDELELFLLDVDSIAIHNDEFYLSGNVNKGLFWFSPNLTDKVRVLYANVSAPIISSDELIFSDINYKMLFKMNLEDESITRLCETESRVDYINILEESLVYSDNGIKKFDVLNNRVEKLSDISAGMINIIGQEIWFVGYSNGSEKLYKMDKCGNNTVVIA